jgi:hypothetical protein
VTNGKPGDHPLTDITVHRLPRYSPEVDALVIEIARLASDRQHQELADLLLRNSGADKAEFLEPRLTEMRDRLRADALERGWEVDP